MIAFFLAAETLCQINSQGVPFIRNYSSIEYQFHPRNFSIIQDKRGIIYTGNAYGVLEFDGINWKSMNLPNGTSAISFASDTSNGRLYVGSVGEIGYLDVDLTGEIVYKSLADKISASERSFGEVWRTFVLSDQVIFCSYQQILVFKNNSIHTYRPLRPEMIYDFFDVVDGKLYCRESGRGLLEYANGQLVMVSDYFSDHLVYHMSGFVDGKSNIISDVGTGVFDGRSYLLTPKSTDQFITENDITRIVPLRKNIFAASTVDNGILVFDGLGNPLQHLSKKNGLPSDYIFDLYVDDEDNIWAATDNGISHIQLSSPFTSIHEQAGLQGMGYASYVFDNKLYLGTSKGLYVKEWKPYENPLSATAKFHFVKNTEGQVWSLGEADGKLFCGHTSGLFQVNQNEATKISPGDDTGGWMIKSIKNKPYFILGTYSGLEVYEKKGNSWRFRNKVSGFDESSRSFEIDENNIVWVCHGNKGLYKLVLSEDLSRTEEVENVSVSQGFSSDYFNDLARIEGSLVFAGENHVYRYNPLVRKLERYDELNAIISNNVMISKIGQQPNGNIWIVNDDIIEVLIKQSDGTFIKDATRFSKLKGQLIGSYEFFWRYDDLNYFIGTQQGFVHFDASVPRNDKQFRAVIRKVESINAGDSMLFGGGFINIHGHIQAIQPADESTQVSYDLNALRLSYAALFYEDIEKNEFQYFLQHDPNDDNVRWSDWTNVTYKEYTNLWEGDYVFFLRARNIHGVVSEPCVFSFTILPPWYRTTAAYVVYSLVIVMILLVFRKLIKVKIKKEKLRIEREKAKEILLMEKQFAEETLKAEREIILLQNEKLEADVRHKNDELAHLATSLSQKSEFLSQLKKELVAFSNEHGKESKGSLNELIKTIDKGAEFDDSWDHFQTSFDRVHHNFLYKMRERFPFLKSTDLLLCAYIRINKSNKEISSLLNISVSAVEKRRFRLREKLRLDDDMRLTEFLMEI